LTHDSLRAGLHRVCALGKGLGVAVKDREVVGQRAVASGQVLLVETLIDRVVLVVVVFAEGGVGVVAGLFRRIGAHGVVAAVA